MKRNLKALGLALVAAFAMSAVAASGVQATAGAEFTASQYSVAITGHQEGATNYFEFAGRRIECTTATYEGTAEEGSPEFTIHPHYTGCEEDSLGLVMTVDLNGCDYLFTVGTTTSTSDVHGSVHIVCPVNQKIQLTIGSLCTVDIPPQTIGGVTYTNIPADAQTPKDYVTVHVDTTNDIHYTETDNSIFCPLTNNGTKGNGNFVSTVRVKGYEDLGTHTADGTGLPTNTEGALTDIDVKTTD